MTREQLGAIIASADTWTRTALDWYFAADDAVERASVTAIKADVALVRTWRGLFPDLAVGDMDFGEALDRAQAWNEAKRRRFPPRPNDLKFPAAGGLYWTLVTRSETLEQVEAALGHDPFGAKIDVMSDDFLGFVLKDSHHVALAVLRFDRPNLLRSINTPYAAGVYGGSVPTRLAEVFSRDAAALGLRLALSADFEPNLLAKEIPDGEYDVDHGHRNAYQIRVENGVIHNADGPAIRHLNGALEWWVHGRRHRESGLPAVLHVKGHREFWRDGVQVSDPADNLREIAIALFAAAISPPSGRLAASPITWFRRDVHKAEMAVAAAGVRWDSSEATAILRQCMGWSGFGRFSGPSVAMIAIKCVRFAGLVAAGEFDRISRFERDSLLHLLDRVPKQFLPILCGTPENRLPAKTISADAPAMLARLVSESAAPSLPDSGDGPVAVRHLWKRSLRGRIPLPVSSTTTVALERVDSASAPVFAVLARPDGGTLELRLIDGFPYRPVLLPDCWRPASEAEFRAAARKGVAWRDSPFSAHGYQDACADSIDERSLETGGRHPADAEPQALSAAEVVSRAGRLVVVDGVVHRRTEFPSIAVVATEGSEWVRDSAIHPVERRYRLAWRLGDDLSSVSHQRTLSAFTDRHAVWDGLFRLAETPRPGETPYHSRLSRFELNPSPPGLSFPADGQDTAADLLEDWARLDGPVELESDFDARLPLVTIVDPSAFTSVPYAPFKAVLNHMGHELPVRGDEMAVAVPTAGGNVFVPDWCAEAASAAAGAMETGDEALRESGCAGFERIRSMVERSFKHRNPPYNARHTLLHALVDASLRTLRAAPAPSLEDDDLYGFSLLL